MGQKTEYVVSFTNGGVEGSLTKREVDKMIRETPEKIVGVDKKVWRDENNGFYELWAEDDYWFNPDAPEPEPVKFEKKARECESEEGSFICHKEETEAPQHITDDGGIHYTKCVRCGVDLEYEYEPRPEWLKQMLNLPIRERW
jgi:hypothetical protein